MLSTLIFLAVVVGVSGTSQPVPTVISGSMEPVMERGTLIAIHNWTDPAVGDVVVFDVDGRDHPIVHRVTRYVRAGCVRTKGDNNPVDDLFLYDQGQTCVDRAHIRGTVWPNVPFLGWPLAMRESLLWQPSFWFRRAQTFRLFIHCLKSDSSRMPLCILSHFNLHRAPGTQHVQTFPCRKVIASHDPDLVGKTHAFNLQFVA